MADELRSNENEMQNELDDDLIVLEDEDGNCIEFQFLEMLWTDGKPYATLMPLDEDDEDAGVVFVEVVDLGQDTEHYDAVTDDAMIDRLFNQFMEEYGDQYGGEDTEEA